MVARGRWLFDDLPYAEPATTRTAGIAALSVSLAVGMTSNLLFLAAFQFRLDWFLEPTRVLAGGATSADCCAGVCPRSDRLLPSHRCPGLRAVAWLRTRSRLIADLSALAALGYVLAGGVGAAVLAMVGPMLIHTYTEAAPEAKPLIAAQFAVPEVPRRRRPVAGRERWPRSAPC